MSDQNIRWSDDDIKALAPQAIAELRGFANYLINTDRGLTGKQLTMVLQLANEAVVLRADLSSTDFVAKHLGQQYHEAMQVIDTMKAERDAAVAEAVAKERERAATLMEDYWNSRGESFYARDTADAIRRGE